VKSLLILTTGTEWDCKYDVVGIDQPRNPFPLITPTKAIPKQAEQLSLAAKLVFT
jgi:hypothetical protein